MDNPRGEIIREKFSAVAEDALGNRRGWGGSYDSLSEAEAAFLALAPPVPFWEELRPCYGSEAYERNWREYEAEEIAREKELG